MRSAEHDRAIVVIAAVARDTALPRNVRVAALRGLGEDGDAVVSVIAAELVDDPDGPVSAHAAATLGRFGAVAEAVSVLLGLLTRSDLDVYDRRFVVDRLGELDDPRVLPALMRIGQIRAEPSLVRLAAVGAIAADSDDHMGLLVAMGVDSDIDPVVRLLVADRLGELGGPTAIDALARMVADVDGSVSEAAIGGLEQVGDPRAVKILSGIASDPRRSALHRLHAARIVLESEPSTAIDALVDIAQDSGTVTFTRTEALSLLRPATEQAP